jgi:hypothetical protein
MECLSTFLGEGNVKLILIEVTGIARSYFLVCAMMVFLVCGCLFSANAAAQISIGSSSAYRPTKSTSYMLHFVELSNGAQPNTTGAANNADAKRFPPYPDIWVWDWSGYIKKKRSPTIGPIYVAPDGDFRLIALSGVDSRNPDGSCCNGRKIGRVWNLFKQTYEDLTARQLSAFQNEWRPKLLKVGYPTPIKLANGTSIFYRGDGGHCYTNFEHYYDAINSLGNVVRSFYVIAVRDKAVSVTVGPNPACKGDTQRKHYSSKAYEFPTISVVPLDDGTSLMWGAAPYILRLDSNLQPKSTLNGHLFLVDAQKIDELLNELGPNQEDFQKRDDVVSQYLIKHRNDLDP